MIQLANQDTDVGWRFDRGAKLRAEIEACLHREAALAFAEAERRKQLRKEAARYAVIIIGIVAAAAITFGGPAW